MADDFEFLQKVKSSTKVTTQEMIDNQDSGVQKLMWKPIGVHLFVMVHGF